MYKVDAQFEDLRRRRGANLTRPQPLQPQPMPPMFRPPPALLDAYGNAQEGNVTPTKPMEAPDISVAQGVKNAFPGALKAASEAMANTPTMQLDPNLGGQFNSFQSPGIRNRIAQPPDLTQFTPRFGGYRAMGGPVHPGYDYVVGENGPEHLKIDKKGRGKVTPLNPNLAPTQLSPPLPPPSSVNGEGRPQGQRMEGGGLSPASEAPPPLGVNDPLMTPQDYPGMPGEAPPESSRKGWTSNDYLYDNLSNQKAALIKRGEKHVSKGASALSYLFQGMEQFGNNMMGRQNKPVVPLGQQRFQNELNTIDRKLIPLQQQRESDADVAYRHAQANKANADALKEQMTAVANADPLFWKQIEFKKYIDQKDVDYAEAHGLGHLRPVDAREFKFFDINGQTMATPTLGAPNIQATNAPVKAGEEPISEKIPGTDTVVTSPSKSVMNRANARSVANITFQGQTAKDNAKIVADNAKDKQKYDAEMAGHSTANTKLTQEGIDAYNHAIDLEGKAAELEQKAANEPTGPLADPTTKRKLEEEANKYRLQALELRHDAANKYAAAQAEADAIKNAPKPTPQTILNTPQLEAPSIVPPKGSTISMATVNIMVKQSKKSKQQIISELEKEGYIVK